MGNYDQKIELEIKHACLNADARFMNGLIEQYCGHDYRGINEYLRFDMDTNSHEYREKSHLLSLIIYLAPRIQNDFFVYRSVYPEFAKQLENSGTTYEKGFMSTTFDFNFARDYCDDDSVLKIYVKNNTPCIFVYVINDREESEILFPPCAGLQLISPPSKIVGSEKKLFECNLFYY